MALRLRRGTDAQRSGIVFAEGELVYTTDTKEVYIGDGTTAGGRPVSIGTVNLTDLGDVAPTAPERDNILVYNGTVWESTSNPGLDVRGNIYADDSTLLVDAVNGQIVGPINSSSITTSAPINADVFGDVTGDVTGNVIGTLVGDVKGTVTADDSTVLVDGVNGTLNGERIANHIILKQIDATDYALRVESYYDDVTPGNNIQIKRARGTEANPADLQPDDEIGEITFFDHNKIVSACKIMGEIDPDGTPTSTIAPGRLSFWTTDNAGTVAERMYIDQSGAIHTYGINYFRSQIGGGLPMYSINNSEGGEGPRFAMRRSRGTFDSPTALQDADAIHRITFGGYDGTAYGDHAFITCRVDGTVAAGKIPTSIDVKTKKDSDGSVNTVATFSQDGSTTIAKLVTNLSEATLTGQTGNSPSTPGTVDSWLEVNVGGTTKYIPLYV